MSFSAPAYCTVAAPVKITESITLPTSLTGSFSIYSFLDNLHTGVVGSTGGYINLFSNMSMSLAHIHRYIYQVNDNISSMYGTLSSMYQNAITPIYTNLTYYLPLYNNYMQAIGQNIDTITTKTDIINTNVASIENNTDTIISLLRDLRLYNNNTTTNDLNVTNNTIQFIYSLVPQDEDNNNERYSLVQYLSEYFANWGIGYNASVLNRKSTRYEDYYVYGPQDE